jgi:hypothetical protein
MRKYLVSGRNTYPKAIYCPNGRQHTDIKMSFQNQLLALLLFQFSYFMLSFSWVAALRLFNDFVKIF